MTERIAAAPQGMKMSKKNRPQLPNDTPAAQPVRVQPQVSPPPATAPAHHVVPPTSRAVPNYRKCPLCHGGKGGVGDRKWQQGKGGTLIKRCYQCNQCGHQWTVFVRTVRTIEAIEYLEVQVETFDGPDLETRA